MSWLSIFHLSTYFRHIIIVWWMATKISITADGMYMGIYMLTLNAYIFIIVYLSAGSLYRLTVWLAVSDMAASLSRQWAKPLALLWTWTGRSRARTDACAAAAWCEHERRSAKQRQEESPGCGRCICALSGKNATISRKLPVASLGQGKRSFASAIAHWPRFFRSYLFDARVSTPIQMCWSGME